MVIHQPDNSKSNYNYNAFTYTSVVSALHFHKNMELIYVMEGHLEVTVNGISQRLEPGMMALVLTNQIHGFTPAPAAKFWVTVFSEEYVPLFAAEMKGKQGKTFVFAPSEAVTMLLKAKLIDQESSRLLRKACFYAVCEEYAASVDMEPRSNKTDFVVGRFLDYVAENYTKELSLRQLAQEFGYEYHYFSRLLSQQYGIRFNQLINRYRVEAAVHWMEDPEISITEAAEKSGFQSIRSFNHIFKEHLGCSPKEYRAK